MKFSMQGPTTVLLSHTNWLTLTGSFLASGHILFFLEMPDFGFMTKASQKVGVIVRLRNLIPKLSLYKSLNSAPSNLLPSSLAFLQCIESEKARGDSGASAECGVQNQISVLSRTATPHQTTAVVQ